MRRVALLIIFAILLQTTNFAAIFSSIFEVHEAAASNSVIFITSTASTTWTVPFDWNDASNTIEVVGGGGGGASGAVGGGAGGSGGGGGGGGAYAKATNVSLTASQIVSIKVGAGGATSTAGGDTYLCNATSNCANLSGSAVVAGAAGGGGAAGTSHASGGGTEVGATRGNGGNGADGSTGHGANGGTGAGAGGAAGCGAATCVSGSAGGGGGNANGQTGGTGDNSFGGAGGGADAAGAGGTEWDASHGSGGGGGGGSGGGNAANGNPGAASGLYGAGGSGGGGGGKGTTTGGNGGSGTQGLIVITYTPLTVNLIQAAYRWFTNTDSASVGSPLAAQNTGMTQNSPGTPFRLRLLMNVSSGLALASSGLNFSLQYVDRGGGTCASPTGTNPSTYTNVVTSTGVMRFYDNPTPASGIALIATSTDPVDGTNTIVNQTYQESNTFTNSQGSIAVGQDGKWDFSLVDNTAIAGEIYCFRIVQSTSTVISAYLLYPQIVVGNAPPSVSNVLLNGGNDITLIVNSTSTIQATATVSDPNGYTDIATVTAKFYRTSLGQSCTLDNNNCYNIPTCSLSSCSGTSCTATCSADIWYFAEPTDSGTPWTGDSWTAWMQATDHSNATGTATSTGVNMLSLLGFGFLSTPTIGYGSFNPGGSFSTLTASTVIAEVGNVSANATLYGTNMTNATKTIAVGNQHYATSAVAYTSGTSLLASPGTTTLIAMRKTTSSSTPASSTIFWGISIPNPQPSGNFSGVNTFIAVKNSLPWP